MSDEAVQNLSSGVCVVLVGLGLPAATTAAAPAPAWLLRAVSNPTTFSTANEENKYAVLLTNVGNAPSNGSPIVLKGTLGHGLTLQRAHDFYEDWSCTEESESSFTCEIPGPVMYGPVGVFGQADEVRVNLKVAPGVTPGTVATSTFTVSGGGASGASSTSVSSILEPSVPTPWGMQDVFSFPADVGGVLDTRAAGHPNSLTVGLDFANALNYEEFGGGKADAPIEDVKDVVVDLPVGFSGNPQAVPECPLSDLIKTLGIPATEPESNCPPASQIGTININVHGLFVQNTSDVFEEGGELIPVFNMVPERGHPAEFGTSYAGKPVMMYASVVGSGANAHVRVTVPGIPAAGVVNFEGAQLTVFGDPAAKDGGATSPAAFITNPSSCSGEPLTTMVAGDSYEDPGPVPRELDGFPNIDVTNLSEPPWVSGSTTTPATTGCEALHFNPSIAVRPETTQADAPTGVGVDVKIPQNPSSAGLATPDLKEVTVALPEGMSVSPSAAGGLQACTDEQFEASSHAPASCPAASQVGTVTATTPVLAKPLEGQVFVGSPECSPCSSADAQGGRLLRLFMQLEGPGLVLKFPGTVSVDPVTGRLTATFKELIQQPVSDVQVQMKGGPRAPLVTPQSCGTYTSTSDLTPWSAPFTLDATPSSAFAIGEGCGAQGFSPSFVAGTANPQAGAYSPFTLTFSRQDSEQDFNGLEAGLPPGLLAKLTGVPRCGEAEANAGSCSEASRIGTVTVGAGPGPDPFYVTGRVFLTGAYNGGPFGEVVEVPAVAGPFNLGTVVVRGSIRINPNTAQASVLSNPLPSILDGIPLQVKTVSVTIDRAGFTFNPTNCDALAVNGTLTSTQGSSAAVSSRFQAANCASLSFKPSFSASTQGRTSRADGASLTVRVAQKAGEANIHRVDLQLPLALPSRLATLNKACTNAQFSADPAGCPAASVIGTATAATPVLGVPLTGPAYLVSHGGAAFPDVEFVLQGEGVQVVLDGETDIRKGITYSDFETVPDAPISSFETILPEGPHSVLTANGKDLCAMSETKTVSVREHVTVRVHGGVKHFTKTVKRTVKTPRPLLMPTTIVGQNGATVKQNTHITVTECPKHKGTRSRKTSKAARK